jgi:hypothetical protein
MSQDGKLSIHQSHQGEIMGNLPSQLLQDTTQQIQGGLLNELFAMLTLRYPNTKWLTDGDIGLHKKLWHGDLKGFSAERIRKALTMVSDHHPTFAPTIGEFKKLIAQTPRPLEIGCDDICDKCHSLRITAKHQRTCLNITDIRGRK